MFGYIRVFQPELKMGEFEQYCGVYCGLCRCLRQRYGPVAPLSLSYDFTFLALLWMSLSDTCTGFRKKHCPYNPLKKRTCCADTRYLDACADAAVLLTYHKVRDAIADGGVWKSFGARLLLPFASHCRKKAAALRPDWDARMTAAMERQATLEAECVASTDAAAEPTADILSFLCAAFAADDREKRVLERFGYCLGRWIYLMDAADDLAEDLKRGSYNPLAISLKEVDDEAVRLARKQAEYSLNASLAQCKAAYELLSVHQFDGILRNIGEYGIPNRQRTVLSAQEVNR